eukprot:TRINITY_DN34203_c0_g1_i4.p1 TRINITY_DN34203_c0_g1~~TRINITY_DN34203_c0_g1_i4.p1  ORF type:complete len:144 (+),score=25.54 TRINITY_DN34203_c0_g1_i4:368-799(+)
MYFSPARTSELNSRSQGGGMNVGASPDARWRDSQLPHGNEFGVSPSTEKFGPMSLGVSPSQLTPPSSQIHVSAGSPGKYGPSPARSYAHVSPLGKVATVGQSNRRRNLGYSRLHYLNVGKGLVLTASAIVNLRGILCYYMKSD